MSTQCGHPNFVSCRLCTCRLLSEICTVDGCNMYLPGLPICGSVGAVMLVCWSSLRCRTSTSYSVAVERCRVLSLHCTTSCSLEHGISSRVRLPAIAMFTGFEATNRPAEQSCPPRHVAHDLITYIADRGGSSRTAVKAPYITRVLVAAPLTSSTCRQQTVV